MKIPKAKRLPSGSWNIGLMVEGRRMSITAPTEKECVAKAAAVKAGMEEAKGREEKVTVDEAIRRYMEAGSAVFSPTTLRGYGIIRRNRLQSIMGRDVRSLTRLDVQRAINEEAKRLAPKTVKNTWALLRPVLKDYGLDYDIKLPQQVRRKPEYLSMDEILKLIQAAAGEPCEPQILLAVWLGLRRSEIMGLCWDCVDEERSTVEVRRAMVPDEDNQWVLKEVPKNEGSQRVLRCPAYIMDKLRDLRQGRSGAVRVFPGNPEVLRKAVHRCCDKAGIRDTTVHGLRHANAAVMVALNVVDRYAMARGGWSSDYTFKQIYAYVFPEQAEQADDVVNAFFEGMIGRGS